MQILKLLYISITILSISKLGLCQSSIDNDRVARLLSQLTSTEFARRMDAFVMLKGDHYVVRQSTVQQAFMDLLDRENKAISELAREGKGPADEFGETYAEDYYPDLLGMVSSFADFQDPRTIDILVRSAYNPDSRFASKLAERGDLVLPPLLRLSHSDVATERQFAVMFIREILLNFKPKQLSSKAAEELVQQLRSAQTDANPAVKAEADRVLNQMKSDVHMPGAGKGN
jgi:hypothetical protein